MRLRIENLGLRSILGFHRLFASFISAVSGSTSCCLCLYRLCVQDSSSCQVVSLMMEMSWSRGFGDFEAEGYLLGLSSEQGNVPIV